MKKITVMLSLLGMLLTASCGKDATNNSGTQAAASGNEQAEVTDSVFIPQMAPWSISYIFGGDLSKYYFVKKCTLTRLTRLELEALGIKIEDDHHYYLISLGLVRNKEPFDFPIDQIECLYGAWRVPSGFPDGKFSIHADVISSHNIRVGQADFKRAANLKDLLRSCPNQGDFMVIEDILDIERYFDQLTNKLDIRGNIKPVKEANTKGRKKSARG